IRSVVAASPPTWARCTTTSAASCSLPAAVSASNCSMRPAPCCSRSGKAGRALRQRRRADWRTGSIMYEGVDPIIRHEELAYEDVLPVAWRALPEPFDPAVVGSFAEGNLRVLQTAVALDEHGSVERNEEGLYAADLQRMEMKLNLMLEMMSALLCAST